MVTVVTAVVGLVDVAVVTVVIVEVVTLAASVVVGSSRKSFCAFRIKMCIDYKSQRNKLQVNKLK